MTMTMTAKASSAVSIGFAKASGAPATDYTPGEGEVINVLVGAGASLPTGAEIVLRVQDGGGSFTGTLSAPAKTLTNKCDGQIATTCVCPPCCFNAATAAREREAAAARGERDLALYWAPRLCTLDGAIHFDGAISRQNDLRSPLEQRTDHICITPLPFCRAQLEQGYLYIAAGRCNAAICFF